MGLKNTLILSVAAQNEQVKRIANEVQAECTRRNRTRAFSHEMCNLIIAGYEKQKFSMIPRFDNFHKRRINGKCLTRALYDGDINEQQIRDMYLSAKKLLEEMYRSQMLQRIVGKGKPEIEIVSQYGEIIQR